MGKRGRKNAVKHACVANERVAASLFCHKSPSFLCVLNALLYYTCRPDRSHPSTRHVGDFVYAQGPEASFS